MFRDEFKQLLEAGRTEFRKFGCMVGGVFLFLGFWFYIRHKAHFSVFLWIGFPLVLFGLGAPTLLRPIYLGWMAFAMALGHVVSTVLLTILFYCVVFPIGLAARLCGNDFLSRKLDPKACSYWIKKPSEQRNYEQQY